MSNISNVKIELNRQSAESAVEKIKELLGEMDCLILVGTADAEVSAVLDDGEEVFREIIPLGEGIHIVITVDLPTKLTAGIHEV